MVDDDKVTEMIEALEKLAFSVLSLKRISIPRRPIVIEFCGSPKAGKTSCINALAMFLRRNNFKVKVLVERASVCPINSKYDPLFNIWTVCSAIAELSETISNSPKEYDVVILDRGLFDALCWFEWQNSHNYLDKDSLSRISNFLTMKRWRAAIDLVLIFQASSGTSIDREYAALLTRKRGSIMREPILETYINAISIAFEKYKDKFRKVEMFDTTTKDQNTVSFEVTKLILEILQSTTAEAVGHIPLSYFNGQEFTGVVDFSANVLPAGECVEFAARPIVENDESAVQPIPILVITNKSRTHVLTAKKNKKAARETSPEHNKTLLYFGGHTRLEDSFISGRRDILSVCRSALTRELKEETGIDFCPEEMEPIFLVWEKDNERSKKHLAICYVWDADPDSLQIRLDRNEFAGGVAAMNTFLGINELKTADLESWSQAILSKVFNMQVIQQSLPLDI